MSFLAANPAGFPHLFPCLVERAIADFSTSNEGGGLRPSCGGQARSYRAAITAGFRSQRTEDNSALARVCRYVSRLMLGHRFGVLPAPGGARSSASPSAPLRGLGSSQNKFAKRRQRTPCKLLSGPSEKADLRPWEPDPLARLRPV
jgi:hypothetical protein